jgi:hypothetical protein
MDDRRQKNPLVSAFMAKGGSVAPGPPGKGPYLLRDSAGVKARPSPNSGCLNHSFRAGLAEKPVSSATGPLQRALIKWGALNLPWPWPKGLPTRPEVDQEVGGTSPRDFEADRQDLLRLIERFTTPARRSPHPIFGAMSEAQSRRGGTSA